MHSKIEVVACKTLKINIVFTAAVVVHITKYISGQHLYEEEREEKEERKLLKLVTKLLKPGNEITETWR